MGRLTRRITYAAIVLLLCLFAVMPTAASAHVKARYRAQYAKELTSFGSTFDALGTDITDARQHSLDLATDMRPLIGDPEKREQLLAAEAYALRIYAANDKNWSVRAQATDWKFEAFLKKTTRYFASAADRRAFKSGVRQLKLDFGLLSLAHNNVNQAFKVLGTDPPDLDEHAEDVALCDDDLAEAVSRFTRDLAALKKLR